MIISYDKLPTIETPRGEGAVNQTRGVVEGGGLGERTGTRHEDKAPRRGALLPPPRDPLLHST